MASNATPADETVETVRIRRAPKYGTFILLGGFIGLVAAGLATFLLPENPTYSQGQVLGYLSVVFAAFGLGLGALVAWLAEVILRRRPTATLQATRTVEEDAFVEQTARLAEAETAQE